MTDTDVCPICGYDGLSEPARHANGTGGYEICPCCWFEFGVTDDDLGWSDEDWRARWEAEGMPWRSTVDPAPADYNAGRQLDALLRDDGPTSSP